MSQSSPMSITQLVNSSEVNKTEDTDVMIAAEALGDMARISSTKKGNNPSPIILPPLSTPSTTPSSPLSTPYLEQQRFSFSSESTTTLEDESKPPQFIHRVSNIPLVNSALRAYETSKNSISVVKYGAEMVESFAAPIYDKLGKHALSTGVNEWGCRQLDKLEERYPKYVTPKQEEEDEDGLMLAALARTSLEDNEGIRRRRDSRDENGLKSRPLSRSTSPHRPYTITKSSRHRQPPHRSKWHQIVIHASSAAGTTAAVVSEESMKCLRYCLTWLQYAAQHIERQISLLQSVLVSLAKAKSTERSVATTQESAATAALEQIKKEIVNTLRKVVEVVSKYAGSGLPEQAKQAVRGFILALPTRWANLNNNGSSDDETSIKLLTFGSESVEMIKSVSLVFSDTIDRAELWLSRLRVVGVAGAQTRDPVKMSVTEQMEM